MIKPTGIELKLVERSLEGDQRAQHQLYRKYVEAMFNTVIRMVSNRTDAEDILQEVFINVFQKLSAFRGDSTLGAWIKKIAINTTLNFIRKRRELYFMETEALESKMPKVEEEASTVPYSMSQIHHAVKELPEGCRIIFSLYLLEGYSHQEIAEILDINISTSKTQYRRAKLLMMQKLKSLQER